MLLKFEDIWILSSSYLFEVFFSWVVRACKYMCVNAVVGFGYCFCSTFLYPSSKLCLVVFCSSVNIALWFTLLCLFLNFALQWLDLLWWSICFTIKLEVGQACTRSKVQRGKNTPYTYTTFRVLGSVCNTVECVKQTIQKTKWFSLCCNRKGCSTFIVVRIW